MADGSILLLEACYEDRRNGEDLTVNKQVPRTKGEMQFMFEKFKQIYQQRLREAEKTPGSAEEKVQLHEAILKSYVKDLTEQNELLVKTLGNLEEKTNQKVKLLQNTLFRTSSSVQEYASRTQYFEEEILALTNVKMELQLKCRQLEEEAGRLRLQNASLTRDLNCLVHILKIARSTQHWEIKSLHLQSMRMEDLFSEESDKSSDTISKENAKNLETHRDVSEPVIRPSHKMNNDTMLLSDHLSVRHRERNHGRRDSNPQVYNEVSYNKVQSDLKQALLDKDILANEILKKDELITSLQNKLSKQEKEFQALQSKLIPSNHNSEDAEPSKIGSKLKDYQLPLMSEIRQKTDTMLRHHSCLEMPHDQQRIKACEHENKIEALQKQVESVSQEKDELLTEVNDMSVHLNKLHTSFEETRSVLTAEIAEKFDIIKKLKEEQGLLEIKYKEAVMTITHRGEVIKELRKEVKDFSNNIASIEETNSQLTQEIISLQSQLKEQDDEIIEVKETARCQLEEKLQLIEDLQNKLNDFQKQQEVQVLEQQQFRKKDEDIKRLKVLVETLNRENRSFANALIRRDTAIQGLESDLDGVRQHYQDALEEIGRLNARLQTFTITAQNEQSLVTQELKSQEETIHRYRLDQMRLQDLNSQANEKISQQERINENLQSQHKAALQEISEKNQLHQRLQQQLHDIQRQNHSYSNEVFQLKDKIEQMKQEMQQTYNHQDNLQDQLLNRDEELKQWQQNSDQIQQQKRETLSKVSEQESVIEKQEAEIAALRLTLFKKTSEAETQQEAIQRLEYSFTQSLNDVENGRRKADKEIFSQAELVKQLREDLMESQRQYSACYDEVLLQENIVENIKQQNNKLAEEIKSKQLEITEMNDKLTRLDIELTLSKERHKTCQKEVGQRDQEIIKGQTTIDTLQHKLQLVNNEVNSKKNENQRLENRLTDLQMEIKQYKLQQEIYRQQIDDGKNIIAEMETQKDQLDEKILNYIKNFEELKRDLKTLQLKYETTTNVLKEKSNDHEQQLQELNQKLSESETTIFSQKKNLITLRKESEDYHHKYQQVQKESHVISNLLLHKEQGLKEEKQKVIKLEEDVRLAKTELEQLEKMFIGKQTVQEELTHTNSTLSILEKKIQDYREEIVKKNTKIVSLEEDLTNTRIQLEESQNRINCVNTALGQQTQDLNQAREELENKQKLLQQLEENLQQVQEHLMTRTMEVEEKTRLLLKNEKNFEDYRKIHKQDVDEFDELEHKVRELDAIIRSMQYLLEERTQENMQIQQQLIQQQEESMALKTETKKIQIQSTKFQECTDEMKEKLQQQEEKYNEEKSELEKKLKLLEENLEASFKKIKDLEQHITKQEKWIQKSDEELKAYKNNILAKVDEIEQLENTIKILKSNLGELKRRKCELNNENELLKLQNQKLSSEHQTTKEEQKKLIKTGTYQEEKIFLMERTVNSFKEQLSGQRGLNLQQRYNQELSEKELHRRMEENKNLQLENKEQQELIEEMKKDLVTMARELQHGMQVYQKHKSVIITQQEELKTIREHERKLEEEIDKKMNFIMELEELLHTEKDLCLKLQKDLENLYIKLAEMNRINSNLQEQVKSKDASLHETTLELEAFQKKVKQLTENLAEKEQQLRQAESHQVAIEQNTSSQSQQIFFSDTITKLQKELIQKEEENKQNLAQLKEKSHLIQELKVQLTPLQSHHQEVLSKLSEQGKQTVSLKLELAQASQQNESLMQELSMMETTLSHLKTQLHQTQESADKKELELSSSLRKYEDVCSQMHQYETELKHSLLEISQQEENLLGLRVELNELNNKYQQKLGELKKLQQQLFDEQRKVLNMEKEMALSREALEDAKTSTNRLRQESHQVADSINSWISHQKSTTETLEKRIREQQCEITELLAQKQKLLENNHAVRKISRRLKERIEEQKLEFQKRLPIPQNSMPHYSSKSLQNVRHIEPLGKNNMVEDLLKCLRSNVDSIVQMNHQLSASQREKAHLEAELEQEVIARRILESKLEWKDQTIANLQLPLQTFHQGTSPIPSTCHEYLDPSIKIPLIYPPLINTQQENIKYSSSDAHEYWVRRAKQISSELQQSSGYWSHKIEELTSKLSPIKNNCGGKQNNQ